MPGVGFFDTVHIVSWDILLDLGNLLLPKRRPSLVVPAGHPGFEGNWPEYVAVMEGDSRGACPGLNAMANHGIISHDGRQIPFVELTHKLQHAFNLSPTFCLYLMKYASDFFGRDYKTGAFDLSDLSSHNGIEHDGSLIREDSYFEPDPSKIAGHLIEDLLSKATGKNKDGKVVLTNADLARALSQRMADSKEINPEFNGGLTHRIFAYGNCGTIAVVLGGIVEELRPFLLEERLMNGWQPRNTMRYGLTFGGFNRAAMRVGVRMKTVPPSKKKESAALEAPPTA